MPCRGGGSGQHSAIAASTISHLDNLLRDYDCTVNSSDLRVHIAFKQGYRYPDVTVYCNDPIYHDNRTDTITNPLILVEVLSPATELIDRKKKLEEYTRIDSLQVYMLIAQDKPRVEVFQRDESNNWIYKDVNGMDATIQVTVFGTQLTIQLAEIYRRARWDNPTTDTPENNT